LARNGDHEFTISENKKEKNFSNRHWTDKSALISLMNFNFARKLFRAVLTLSCDATTRKSRKLICPTSDLCGEFSYPRTVGKSARSGAQRLSK